ncbi:Protein OS-9-like protein [Psilocybe cubensis]|uniref:Protein OS-9-like protein n=2 Tax=Psilocybe cubensis TaxID=181762 RepID=A0ACB8H891_PSICU|nr:Protein OS-9-like protein [Psilocybe cubensis]KAH9484225.1 Protein OS-9-like protein [Psilocybe cubensis]
MRRCCLLLLPLVPLPVFTRLLHSLPEDPYAFPKYRVSFLNGLPVLNHTAERWLAEGLRGGELEFLDQPWNDSPRKEIGSAEDSAEPQQPISANLSYTLQHMRMGPRDSYVCLIPQPIDPAPPSQEDDTDADMTPARSWSLLQPLTGTCLYHRQGWFTYSYCHNDEIRQFKEAVPAQTRFPGTYTPEEDPGWDAYTLGRAPQNPEPGADLTVAEQNAQAANLELARNAGSRYLVQRWGDGSICDKTNTHREVEVQFHCSMEMTDHILFVKETKTCSYVLVIHTPRLCGEPGFRSRRDSVGEAEIRCREVVDTKPEDHMNLPAADHPVKIPLRKTVLPAPVPNAKGTEDEASIREKSFNDLLRKTLAALVGKDGAKVVGDGELIIELADELEDDAVEMDSDRLVDALRAAGYNVQAEVITLDGKKVTKPVSKDGKQPEKDRKKHPLKKHDTRRDEL